MRRKKQRRVAKDKVFKTIPKNYLSGTKGAERSKRARAIKKMRALYKAGKRVPKSIFKIVFGGK